MVENLLSILDNPSKLVFFSSNAAGPDISNVYGQAKFHIETLVKKYGGHNFVLGGVLGDAPGLSETYPRSRVLYDLVKSYPLALRFVFGEPQFYPIEIRDLLSICDDLVDSKRSPETYGIYLDRGIGINRIFKIFESEHQRLRIPFPLPLPLVRLAARLALTFKLVGIHEAASKLCERDAGRLEDLPKYPGIEMVHTKQYLGVKAQ
jgi:hypothetical protein